MTKTPSRLAAILLAILVTFFWSTSWVLIKIGLRNSLPALSFAGLRYFIAFLCLIPLVLINSDERAILKNLNRSDWSKLIWLGVTLIALTQGAQFVSLAYLPSVMVSLLLNLSPIMVGFMSLIWYREPTTKIQWTFLPVDFPRAQVIGLLAAAVGILSNAYATLFGRHVNQQSHLSPLIVTSVSMGIGSILMLAAGGLTQGLGKPSLLDWGIILWLAIVNTALAFTLWNFTQRTLTAIESSLINSLMLPQIAILAFIFLSEMVTLKEIVGLLLVGFGVLIVQWKSQRG
ncbi:MAG: DMT family transporter [Chloroflexi bacterium]|nr:DMT family transporter [Chloroflexota bacterium]